MMLSLFIAEDEKKKKSSHRGRAIFCFIIRLKANQHNSFEVKVAECVFTL